MDRDSYRLGSNIIAKYYVWQIWPPYPCMLHLEYITYLSQNLLNQFFLLKLGFSFPFPVIKKKTIWYRWKDKSQKQTLNYVVVAIITPNF